MKRTVFLVLLAALFVLANVARGAYRARVEGPRFAAEGAAHYRYTEMVARGASIPAVDVRAQWPEGLRVFREASPAMEYLFGWVYRLLPGDPPPLPAFIRFFTAFVFSLAILPVALLSASLWRSRAAAIGTALVFATALPLVARSSGFEYLRENLTVPLIAYHAWCFVESCRGSRRAAPAAGTLLFAALLSWQGAQFYLVPFLAFALARAIGWEIGSGERRAMRWTVAAVAAAGIAVPYLREGRFLLSIPAALAAAWLALDAGSILASRRGARRAPRGKAGGRGAKASGGERPASTAGLPLAARAAVAVSVAAAILVPSALLARHFETYAHFFDLVVYKARYLVKPDDPRLLPFDARAFWVGPFNSPDALHFFVFALPILLLLPGPASILVRRAQQGEFEALFTVAFLAAFFVLFLLMQRLAPLFGIFAAVAAGGAAVELRERGAARAARSPAGILSVAVIAIFLAQDFGWEGRGDVWRRVARTLRVPSRDRFVVYPYARDVEGELLAWMRSNLERDAVVMSLHYLSPQVLTYADRATNLNDFFESPRSRRKAERLLASLYAPEATLERLCAEQGSRYLLLSCAVGCDPTKESPLYQAGLVNMPPGCAAYRLMFEPERLERFDLVYENEMYRLFRVGSPPAPREWPRSPLFYDRDLLWGAGGDIRGFYNSAMRIYALTARARTFLSRGDAAEAERTLVETLNVFYFYPAWRELDRLYARRGRLEERAAAAAFAYRSDPNRADVCLAFAESRIALGNTEGAREALERCRRLPAPASVAERAAKLLAELPAPTP